MIIRNVVAAILAATLAAGAYIYNTSGGSSKAVANKSQPALQKPLRPKPQSNLAEEDAIKKLQIR